MDLETRTTFEGPVATGFLWVRRKYVTRVRANDRRTLYVVSDLEELSRCHPDFLLCQFIQSLESVLDICISQQLL